MAGTISENVQSRQFSVGGSTSRELLYDIVGAADEVEVETLIRSVAPLVYQNLLLRDVSAEVVGGNVWKGPAKYVALETEYTFDTTGGNQKMTQSLATVSSYAPAGLTAPDFKGAIGVSDDRVEGVDVPTGAFTWGETHQFQDATVTYSYQRTLALLSGRTYNSATFKGWSAGEVNFLGCSGVKRPDALWSLTFKFAASPNQTGLSVGDITGISKLGWDYLWVRYADYSDTSAAALVKRPVAAYVERVLTAADYSLLGIGV